MSSWMHKDGSWVRGCAKMGHEFVDTQRWVMNSWIHKDEPWAPACTKMGHGFVDAQRQMSHEFVDAQRWVRGSWMHKDGSWVHGLSSSGMWSCSAHRLKVIRLLDLHFLCYINSSCRAGSRIVTTRECLGAFHSCESTLTYISVASLV